jgi:hypothetical protein
VAECSREELGLAVSEVVMLEASDLLNLAFLRS